MNAARRAEIGTSLCLTAPQTIACSAFYEAEFPSTQQYFELQPHSIHYRSTVERYRTTIDGPRGGPNQSIKVGQIKLTETLGRRDRFHRHPAHLGTAATASSPCALCGAGRWPRPRWRALDRSPPRLLLPVRVLSPGSSAGSSSSSCSARSVPVRCTSMLSLNLRDAHAFAAYLAPAAQAECGGVCQAGLRRRPPRARLSRPLYPSRGDLQRPAAFQRRPRHLPLEGLSTRCREKDHDPGRRRIHSPLPVARSPAGFQHIRHYGFLANRYHEAKLAHCRQLLHLPPPIVQPSTPLADYTTVPRSSPPIPTRLPTLRQRTYAADRHLPRPLALTCTPTGYFVMLHFRSQSALPILR